MSSTETTDSGTTVYRIVSRVNINKWVPDLQQAVSGWEIRAIWISTGTALVVFVPDSQYTAQNVDMAIRHAGAVDESVHALGG